MSTITWAGGLPGSYSITLGSNWVGGIVPGTNDIADFNAAQTGPYTLLGNASWAEAQFEGDTATLKGIITASDILSTELDIENGGMLTIASGAAFTGSYNAQIGAAATAGGLAVYGTLSMGALDVYQDGVLGIGATAVVTGDINLLGGQLSALAPGGTIVSLDNAVHLLSSGTLLAAAPGGTLALSGGIDGTGALSVVYGNVAFDAVDSYSGGTTIASGATALAGADDALGSGVITISGTLLGTQTATLHNEIQTSGNALIEAATGTTLSLDGRAATGVFHLAGGITFGGAGHDGVVELGLATGGWGTPSFTIAGGTARELNLGFIGGYALSIAAGATLDVNGGYDYTGGVDGTGVITSESGPGGFGFYTGTFAGTIAGQTSLSILGNATLTGAEISSLGIEIFSSEVLQLGNGGSIGAFTAPSIDDEGLLVIDLGSAATIDSSISGAGSVAVTGTAPVTLNHTNSYAGDTTIASGATVLASADDALSSGVVTLSGALIGTQTETLHNQLHTSGQAVIAAASGTTLTLDGSGSSAFFDLAGSIIFGAAGDDGVVAIKVGGGVWGTPSYTIASGTMRELGSGIIGGYALSIAAGATLDVGGGYDYTNGVAGTGVITSGSGPGGFGLYTGTFAGTIAGQTSLSIFGHTTLTGTDTSSLGIYIYSSEILQLGNGGGLGAFTAGIDDESLLVIDLGTAASIASSISGAGSVVVTGTAPVTLDATNSYTGGTTIASGATVLAAADEALGSGTIVISGALIGTQTETLDNQLQTSGNVLLAAASGTTLTIDGSSASGAFNLSGGITIGTAGDNGVVALGFGGGGWLTPSFTIAAGTLRELHTGHIEGYSLSIAGGATLDISGIYEYGGTVAGTGVITSESAPGEYDFYTGTFAGTIAGQTTVDILGAATLSGSDISTLGVTIWSGATLQLGNGGSIGAFTAPSITDTGELLIDVGTAATIGSSITGAGSLAVTGTAPVTLDATNSYSGGTTIASGATVLAAADEALGSGTIVISGALIGTQTETLDNQLQTSGNVLLAAASGTTLTIDGSSASGAFHLGGGITIGTAGDNGVVALGFGGGGWLTPSFTIANGTLRELHTGHIEGYSLSIAGGATLDISGIYEYGGTVAGTGVITSESAPGEYDFYTGTFAGTIAGQTTVDILGAATLSGSDISTLGVTIWSGATLQLGNGGSIGVFTAPVITDTGELLIDVGTSLAIAGDINSAGSLVDVGTGLVILSGSNAYTGGSTLGAGTLALGSGTALGVSGLIITGGTLLGETAATIGNAISLQGAAHIGATAGSTLNLGGLLSGFGNIIADTPGLLALEGANNYTGGTTLGTGAAVYAGNASALGVSDVLLTGNDRLIVGNASDLIETIDGFTVGDTIELAGFTVSSLSFSGGVLSAADSLGTTIDLNLSGVFAPGGFSFHNTAAGAEIVVCYLRGTRIATPDGEVEIEQLRRGDMVMTRKGARRIKWIGEQRYARRFLKDNRDMLPVCITAGALAEGVPARDLFVSPGHAMLLDGVLVLARDLVNGVTITQFWAPDEVHYFNIELNSHGCVLAEGAWAETYADCPGLRAKFHNAASFHELFPEHVVPAAPRLCAPRVSAGASLAASLAPILARAAAETTPGRLRGYVERAGADGLISGWAQDEANPELPVTLEIIRDGALAGTVLAHEQRDDLRAAGIGPGRHGFRLKCPPGATVELRSRATGQPLPALPRPARAGKRA